MLFERKAIQLRTLETLDVSRSGQCSNFRIAIGDQRCEGEEEPQNSPPDTIRIRT